MNMLAKAIVIASKAHEKQLDKGGKPYILHPIWVMNNVRHLGEDAMIVGILHDVVEDSDWTIEELRNEGFSENIIEALQLLDFTTTKSYMNRIYKIYNNDLAKAVKTKDIEHNSRITRLKGITSKDEARMKKYQRAYLYLTN